MATCFSIQTQFGQWSCRRSFTAAPVSRRSMRSCFSNRNADVQIQCTEGLDRRSVLQAAVVLLPSLLQARQAVAAGVPPEATFVTTDSGLRVEDIRLGTGAAPNKGDRVVVHWAGYTENYQAKRIENTSVRDEPFEFVLGADEVIPAFEEAVSGMRAGGLRRIEVPGDSGLGWPRERGIRYARGPVPSELGGKRALDFVLDNPTLQPTNRQLLLDIKLLSVRKRS